MYGEAELTKNARGNIQWNNGVLKIEKSMGLLGTYSKRRFWSGSETDLKLMITPLNSSLVFHVIMFPMLTNVCFLFHRCG